MLSTNISKLSTQLSTTQVEEEMAYEKYTREQVEKEQKRIEAERAERVRERLRDREALQWNNKRAGQIRAQERMDTGEEEVYPSRLRYVSESCFSNQTKPLSWIFPTTDLSKT